MTSQGKVGRRTALGTATVLAALVLGGCGHVSSLTGPNAASGNPPVQVQPPIEPSRPAETAAPANDDRAELESSGSNPSSSGNSAPDPGSRPAKPSAPAKADRCHTSMLSGSLQEPDAGAGQRGVTLVLNNKSSETCTIYGYGGLQLLDDSGQELPTNLTRAPKPAPKTVQLAPGQSASTSLTWSAMPHGDEPESGCQFRPARAKVTPPDEQDPLTVAWSLGPVCDGGSIEGNAYHR